MRSFHRLILSGSLAASLLILATGLRGAPAASSAEQWLTHYYQHPAPNQFASSVLELSRSGYLDESAHVPLAIGFFASVFAQNPGRIDEWMAIQRDLPPAHQRLLIASLWYSGNAKGRDYLRASLRDCEPGVRQEISGLLARNPSLRDAEVLSPSSLNLQWGAFLATGDEVPVRTILAALGTSDNLQLSQDVRYSLAQNAVEHERVLAICRAELSRQPKPVRETLRAVILDSESRRSPSS